MTDPDVHSHSPAEPGDDDSQLLDPKLLDLLVCPLGKGPLEYDRENRELISRQAGLAYPIRDGVPIMLIDEARRLDELAPGGGSPAA
ncbi:Trm112 family protein [Roseospira visakhapatnamensis]|uniref:UPF0434 protein GGD89_002323 n=1 Tax=Roseospira visakhapatnamensis TaxID=390880 RepID=A0A7W6WA02_9PROT|nr:Trm112 family protein [Roseospira visakhapatnamensis]MBB4266690.1 hypothetical protein [Roseospira visakhapatnamensis]